MRTIENKDILKALKPTLKALRVSESFTLDLTTLVASFNKVSRFKLDYNLETLAPKVGEMMSKIFAANHLNYDLLEGDADGYSTLYLQVNNLKYSKRLKGLKLEYTI